MSDFLLELGCEEIPARMIDAAAQELCERVSNLLARENLAAQEIRHLDTPRRLALIAAGIPATQPDVTELLIGPSTSIAYKEGKPTAAAQGFAKKSGVDISQFEVVNTPKGDCISARITKKGRSAAEIFAENLPKEVSSIYWPKNMYWRTPGERFVRPVRWLVAMLDGEVIPLEFDGIFAGNISRGHRVLSKGEVKISNAVGAVYVDALRSAKVLGRAEREYQIRKALDAATHTIPDARWRADKTLLDTAVNLTEFPSAILGSFDSQFLALPEEVLVTVMRDHQKYFAVEDTNGKLLPHFLAVLNTDGDPQGLIRHGNERVLRARFNDARFFWETDQKRSLLERLDLLRNVTFQKDLGSYYDKTRRVQRLCSWLSEIVKRSGMAVRPGVIHKAGALAKTDLTTELVKEFTELQGIIGGLYARAQVLDSSVPEATRFAIADAVYDHYKPESTEDQIPRSIEGAILSIGDKADTIAGMFSLGLVPSGSKDPFALRRQANGIVRIIAEKKLPLRLSEMMRDARTGYRGSSAERKFVDDASFNSSVKTFFRERLEFYLKDVRGYKQDIVRAVLAVTPDDIVDAVARVDGFSLAREIRREDLDAVCNSFKRVKNILKQAEEKSMSIPKGKPQGEGGWLLGNLSEAEAELYRQGYVVWAQYEQSRHARDYPGAISHVASLRPSLTRFFDEVLVLVDDPVLRANRLGLLQWIYSNFSTIADFSEIVAEGK
jgi:glycyl-tRNA synthetase beta chain